MRALLRFQAVLFLRQAMTPQGGMVAVALATLLGAVWVLDMSLGTGRGGPGLLVLMGGAQPGLAIMVMTLDGMDVVRWTSPVRAVHVLVAHLIFWTVVWAIPASGLAYLRSGEGHPALPLFFALMLLGTFSAASALTFQRQMRRKSVVGVLIAFFLVVGSAGAAVSGVVIAWMGDAVLGMVPLGIVSCIALAAGSWSFLRDEGLPVAAGKTEHPTSHPGSGMREAGRARTTAISILRGAWSPWWTALWVAMGVMYQFLPQAPDWFTAIWIPLSVLNLANLPMSSWKWLLATPLDRDRAFRILFLPLVAFAGLLATTRYMTLEMGSDRSELLHDFRKDQKWGSGYGLLVQGNLLRRDPASDSYCDPEPPYMAARVREHILTRFGLDVPEERILADILRGWPVLGTGWSEKQDALLDAMGRIQVDLGPELKSADRLRRAVSGLLGILIAMMGLRLHVAGFRRSRILVPLVLLPTLFLLFPPDFGPDSGVPDGLLLPGRVLYAVFQDTPAPMAMFFALVAGGLACLLWRSSAGAFRRLDITDLPPPVSMKGWWGRRE